MDEDIVSRIARNAMEFNAVCPAFNRRLEKIMADSQQAFSGIRRAAPAIREQFQAFPNRFMEFLRIRKYG